ncbi:hypothetical protein [Microbacterium sp. A93]|uniref:hypothetical protein n=1 Tax=unclassified Microbacterium TaxID=2609290 RepID=UPI003F42BEC6
MRAEWNSLVVDAIDYEIARIGTSDASAEIGAFHDVFLSTQSPWRMVSGYLMLEADALRSRLNIFSHGRVVASLFADGDNIVWSTARSPLKDPAWRVDGSSIRTDGIALVPMSGDAPHVDGNLIVMSGGLPWAFTIVHGPAESKIDARIRLLMSLERTGGRRG